MTRAYKRGLTKEQRNAKKYTIRNADTESRQVIVEHPAEEEWELTPSTPKPEESSESFHRFHVSVEAGKTAELTVESVHPEETAFALTNLDHDEVALLVQQKRMTPPMQQAFDRILKQKGKSRRFLAIFRSGSVKATRSRRTRIASAKT